jgi:serine protease
MADPDSGRVSTTAPARLASEVQVLEFRRDPGDYFLTVDRDEIAALDAGSIPGWARTGEAFFAYAADSAIGPNLSPVCRFFGRPGTGQHSHFFSAYADECAAVAAWSSDQWLLESPNVFVVALPDAGDGSCTTGTVPVSRLYNNQPGAVDHRYTTSRAIQAQMIAAGWLAEGSGPAGVAMCAPAS